MTPSTEIRKKADADYVFYELTRTLCPVCRKVVDGHVLIRDDKVYIRRRCPQHGVHEGLVYGDAKAYVANGKYNKPGTIPINFTTEIERGCPHDCGLCPDHQQHTCLGIIEVNSACNMDCPLCFANATHGFSLTLQEVEGILDHLVETEGNPEVVQFSGGEPSIHPQILDMLRAAKARNIRTVMLNTNGKRIANDDRFLEELAKIRPAIYFQFDGFDRRTYEIIRGEPDILEEKMRALDRLAEIDLNVVLVPAIEKNVNEHEIGRLVLFAAKHPAVRGVNFQPAFHSGRFGDHDPMQRVTIPDILRWMEDQTDGVFKVTDFVPVPCCFPTCNSVTYAWVDDEQIMPISRLLNVEDYLDYISNRVLPDIAGDIRTALEGLWSSSVAPGSEKAAREFQISCASCDLPKGLDLKSIEKNVLMVMLQDFLDPYTFSQKALMKCCKEILLPDGKQIPFCAYNNVGYREQAFDQLRERTRERAKARHEGREFNPGPLEFKF